MEKHGHGDRALIDSLLHDPVTALLAYRDKTVSFQNPAHLIAGKDAKLTQ
jgi:hypothetical protein